MGQKNVSCGRSIPMDLGARHVIGPLCVLRPMIGEPLNGGAETADSDVAAGLDRRELLAVAKNARTDRHQRKAVGLSVGKSESEDVLGLNHAGIFGISTASVNGHFTGCTEKSVRSSYRTMDLARILSRIQERLDVLKLSDSGASKLAGKPDAIRNMRRALTAKQPGRKGVNVTTINALAPVLEVTPAWLIYGDEGDPNPLPVVNDRKLIPVISTELPIRGVVEAGAWREIAPEEEEHPEVARVTKDGRFPEAEQYLLRVRGDSMNQSSPQPIVDGALVHCINWADTGLGLQTGMIVVVRRWNGAIAETTVKRVRAFPHRYELVPESSNPIHQPILIERNRDDHAERVDVIALVIGVSYQFPLWGGLK